MMQTDNFQDWLRELRVRRDICMLLPMEASMGYPVEVRCGEEYLFPFYSVSHEADACRYSFFYVLVSYPEGEILTFSRIRFLPNISETVTRSGTNLCQQAVEEYLLCLEQRASGSGVAGPSPDETLLAWLAENKPMLIDCYRFLIEEKYKLLRMPRG